MIRGEKHQTLDASIPTIVSYSLDELLDFPERKALVWDDLLLAKQVLNAK